MDIKIIIFGKKPRRGGCPASLKSLNMMANIIGLLKELVFDGVSVFKFSLKIKKINEEEIKK